MTVDRESAGHLSNVCEGIDILSIRTVAVTLTGFVCSAQVAATKELEKARASAAQQLQASQEVVAGLQASQAEAEQRLQAVENEAGARNHQAHMDLVRRPIRLCSAWIFLTNKAKSDGSLAAMDKMTSRPGQCPAFSRIALNFAKQERWRMHPLQENGIDKAQDLFSAPHAEAEEAL